MVLPCSEQSGRHLWLEQPGAPGGGWRLRAGVGGVAVDAMLKGVSRSDLGVESACSKPDSVLLTATVLCAYTVIPCNSRSDICVASVTVRP
jgi:hypothetical protein